MSKNTTTGEVILCHRGRIESSSPADRSKVKSASEKFFDQAGHLCASLAVAWPSHIEISFPDGSGVCIRKAKLRGPVLTERQKQIVRELLMPMVLEFRESIACTEADREKIKKQKEQHERLVLTKLKNEREKAGAEFLRCLQLAELYHRENPALSRKPRRALSVIARIRTVYGTPLFQALIANDTDFVNGISQQMGHSLSERQKLKKRLIEVDELRHPTGPVPTYSQIWQNYCPGHIDTPENFQHLLKECVIPFAPVGLFRGKHVRKHEKNTC
jgi:hypothetical protein